jgi:diguanylate cyclase (GGDEF)-like protein
MQQKTKTVSIRRVTWRYFALILLLALAGVVFITTVGVYSSRELAQHHEAFELDVLSRDLGDLVGFYRDIARAEARQQEVADILAFADVERAVLWAKELRSIVPESIGMALIDREGNVLGEPLQLNLGEQCVSDLRHMLAGEAVSRPPVHTDVPSLRHFDVMVPVRPGEESLGLLFMSFSLNVLQQRIEQWVGPHHYMRVVDADGNTLAEAGVAQSAGYHQREFVHAAVPGTEWRMHYIGEEWAVDRLFLVAFAIGAVIFVVSLVITLLFYTRLVRIFNSDLRRIKALLSGINSGQEATKKGRETRLLETVSIMEDVSALVGDIEQANRLLKQQSMHDALTGLLNRRAFDESLVHYVGLAERGVRARLVMLDLDLFKQVNDRYGHVVGDEVLKALADTLRERCRSADVLARVGGDEFALIMPGDVGTGIDEWFDDIKQRFLQRQKALNDGKGIDPQCLLSAGSVVVGGGEHEGVSSLMRQVDKLMYEAKRSGRASIYY